MVDLPGFLGIVALTVLPASAVAAGGFGLGFALGEPDSSGIRILWIA